MSATDPETGWTIYSDQHIRGRKCGGCTACCTMVAVELPEGHKPANVRCRYLRSSGCSIYRDRPEPCVYWSCRWLFDPETADLRRPDRAGYIVDPQFSTIMLDGKPIDAIQVYVDPARPDAHQDPALRAYLARMAERFRVVAIVRWGHDEAMALGAPCLTSSGEWEEQRSVMLTHEEMAEKVTAAKAAEV
jgi:hypothetical protein